MMRIAILGANGQVGTEVCLFLKHWPEIEVVGICRSQLAASVLRRLDVDCRCGDIGLVEEAKQLVGDCDLVADFTLPRGGHQQAVAAHDRIIHGAQAAMKQSAPYVLISTQMVLGMSESRPVLKHYWLPGTRYGAVKRAAEKLVRKASRRSRREYYVLRLGQVHGLLQGVSLSLQQLAQDPAARFRVPDGPSYTIFCFSIAEALVNIGRGREQADSDFTAVSNPAWSWKELLEFLGAKRVEVLCNGLSSRRLMSAVTTPLRNFVGSALVEHKDFIQANLLRLSPTLEDRLKTKNRCAKARQSLAACESQGVHQLDCFVGRLPGNRLQSISDSRSAMHELSEACRRSINRLTQPCVEGGAGESNIRSNQC